MTDIQHKPNGWNEPLNQMTEDEWKEYFCLRKELDVEMTEEELNKLSEQISTCLKNTDDNSAFELMNKIPLGAHYAYGLKLGLGLKAVADANLSLARKVFLDEF